MSGYSKKDFDFSKYKYLMEAGRRIFFIGIGGISMSGLAELALDRGQIVAGSDLRKSERGVYLESLGITVYAPHSAEHIDLFKPDAIVYTAAIPKDNVELMRADELSLPCIERSDWLGLLNREFPQIINIAGTNGKSTCTAMCSYICMDAGLDPTVHLGAELDRFRSTIHLGGNELMISEACEFNYSFYSFHSTITSVLNLGHDHVDLFPEMQDVIEAFATYVLRQAAGTKLVLPSFDPYIADMLAICEAKDAQKLAELELYFFGYPQDKIWGKHPDLIIHEVKSEKGLPQFRLTYRGQDAGQYSLQIPGNFNVENAAAAVLMSHLAGADFASAVKSLASFRGAEGRFTICGYYNDALLINDYAHHPDSVAKTIQAAKELGFKKVVACFQPITYSRAKGLAKGFVKALAEADRAILLEVFDDREKDHSFSSAQIAEEIKVNGGEASYFSSLEELEKNLRSTIQAETLVLFMGQTIRQVGDRLAERKDHFS